MDATGLTQVPHEAPADAVVAWVQPLVVVWLLVASLLSVRPLATSGLGGYATALVVLCAAQASSRSLPDRVVAPRVRLAAAVAATVLCGLLFGVASDTWGVSWAYVVAGHVGFRFAPRLAVALAGLTAVVATLALGLGPHLVDDPWRWWTGLTVAAPVVAGIARQNRTRTLANARELVIWTRRAAASEADSAALAERNRIARELHDVLAHSLSGVSVQLDTADALLEAGRHDEGRASLQAARGLVVDGLVQARDAVRTLREDALDLRGALTGSVQGDERVTVTGPVERVPTPTARATLRIVQEALTNTRRHAPGAPVLVEVVADEALHVVVTNQAPSLPVAPFELGGGLGLVGVRERVEALGGAFEAGPVPTGRSRGGWRVAVDLPLGEPTPGPHDGPHDGPRDGPHRGETS